MVSPLSEPQVRSQHLQRRSFSHVIMTDGVTVLEHLAVTAHQGGQHPTRCRRSYCCCCCRLQLLNRRVICDGEGNLRSSWPFEDDVEAAMRRRYVHAN